MLFRHNLFRICRLYSVTQSLTRQY